MNITILGAGAWGSALARLLHQGGNEITLWGHIPRGLTKSGRLAATSAFCRHRVPREVVLEADVPRAIEGAQCIVLAVPSQPYRQVTRHLANYSGFIASVTKGIEYDTGLTMCGILAETAPKAKCAALSGPTFAIEVARDIPTAIVAASRDLATADQVQQALQPALISRLYQHRPARR
jgi:glycerol-3-phosphate dehydrogenase (NAD(P)+)